MNEYIDIALHPDAHLLLCLAHSSRQTTCSFAVQPPFLYLFVPHMLVHLTVSLARDRASYLQLLTPADFKKIKQLQMRKAADSVKGKRQQESLAEVVGEEDIGGYHFRKKEAMEGQPHTKEEKRALHKMHAKPKEKGTSRGWHDTVIRNQMRKWRG